MRVYSGIIVVETGQGSDYCLFCFKFSEPELKFEVAGWLAFSMAFVLFCFKIWLAVYY